MADEEKTAEQIAAEKAAADAQAAAAQTDAGSAGTPGSEGPTPEEVQAELDRTRIALGKANKEAETRRKKLAAMEEEETKRKQEAMSETDRLKAENEELKKAGQAAQDKARETLIRAAFVAEAAKAGAVYPDDVYQLADRSDVSCDDEGKVEGVAAAVKVLVDAGRIPTGTPQAPKLDGGAGGGNGARRIKLTSDEIETARKMGLTPEKYAENKAALAQTS